MPSREVRFATHDLAHLVEELRADPDEIEEVKQSFKTCLDHVEAGIPYGERVPFDQFPESSEARIITCGRFLIVYAFDEEILFPVLITLGSEFEE